LKSQDRNPLLFSRKCGELPLSGRPFLNFSGPCWTRESPSGFGQGVRACPLREGRRRHHRLPPFGRSTPHRRGCGLRFCRDRETCCPPGDRQAGDCYRIWGDNAIEKQEPVPGANVLGRVTRVERNGKDARLGLGPERILIALLCRHRLSRMTIRLFRHIVRPVYAWRQGPA